MNRKALQVIIPAWLLVVVAIPLLVRGHCDTMSGPVVTDARQALQSGKPDAVLKWVRQEDEKEIRDLFEKTVNVRKQSPSAGELVDQYFFETVVRIHRAGEGAPYTGLKEAGQVEPIVQESDHAIAAGNADVLIGELKQAVDQGVRKRFDELKEKEKHKDHNLDAGREYVRAYVEFVHYVEGVHKAAVGTVHAETQPTEQGHQH